MPSNLTEFEVDSLRLVATLAAEGARKLSADKQRQVFLGIRCALSASLPQEAAAAQKAMEALKAADDAQISFMEALTAA
jgi:hypothetical protein